MNTQPRKIYDIDFGGGSERPPLGVMPLWRHNELRLEDVTEAIKRYMDAMREVPQDWINEKYELQQWLKNRPDKTFPTTPPTAQEGVSAEELKEFSRCINALALELPNPVWDDVYNRWLKLKSRIIYTASLSTTTGAKEAWVKVEDGLPESNFDRFMCCLQNEMVIEMNFTRLDGETRWFNLGVGDEKKNNPVTHWMPLPSPPKTTPQGK